MYNYKFLLLDTDHTAYTMTSAGSDGFTTLLPVYLDRSVKLNKLHKTKKCHSIMYCLQKPGMYFMYIYIQLVVKTMVFCK